MARLTVPADRRGHLQRAFDVTFTPGDVLAVGIERQAAGGQWRPTVLMGRICDALTRAGELNFRDLKARVRGKDDHIREALAVLIDEGHVKVRNGPRNAKLHYLEIPFNE